MARLCFGEGAVDEHDVRAIDRAQMEFLFAYAGTKAVEATRLPRVLYRRRWLRLDAAFNRLSYLMITLIIAARRRWTERGCGGGGGGSVTPYVDSLFVLRVPADDAAGGDRSGRLLTDDEMAPMVWEFILAGAETVACSVEWVLAHLVARPEVQEKVHRQVAGQEEHHLRTTPPYLRAVIL
ncbi:cytochrome P450 89A9-like, partial [Setaria italica]|uniref:cytochrome P450 89A9-like n=1 Tax=Setaria italica TaxID=4555 RepID=UPI000647DE7E